MIASKATYSWVHKYIFPGGFIPSVRSIEESVRDHTRLRIVETRSFGHDYAETLKRWRERVGELGFTIDPTRSIGSRISDMTILASQKPVEANRDYVVAGWASIGENTEGPPIWDVVESYLAKNPVFRLKENRSVQLRGI